MHNSMPYDAIQGQGHECLKATQEESHRQSRMGLIFFISKYTRYVQLCRLCSVSSVACVQGWIMVPLGPEA